MGFVFIIIVPLLPSSCGFFFVFGCGVSFFGRFQRLSVDACSTASCDSGALAGDGRKSIRNMPLQHVPSGLSKGLAHVGLCMRQLGVSDWH